MLPLATAAAAAADAADARDEAGDRFHRSRPWQHAVNIWSLVMTPVQFAAWQWRWRLTMRLCKKHY